ncbi:MAG: hypothetical protein KF779_15170 [Hyphomonadaceae bacterium]|nr:hypothetical protein [Hyphomonadaceae bacterium]
MSKPRITFAIKKDEQGEPVEVYLYLNPDGRDQLVAELQHLSEQSDHFHMQHDELIAEVLMRDVPYESDEIIPWHVKVMLRPDDWDRRYFPHVMKDDAPSA